MKTHTDILNYLAEKYGLKTYLEIGVQNPDNNFNLVKCEDKIGVDPEVCGKCTYDGVIFKGESDNFFTAPVYKENRFDLVFIDGLHHAEQVEKDFENALSRLTDGGFIVLHDCNPEKEEITKVPRKTKEWTGDCYRFASTLCWSLVTIHNTVNIDYGCCVVQKIGKGFEKLPGFLDPPCGPITWEYFDKNRKQLLNLVTPEEFKTIL